MRRIVTGVLAATLAAGLLSGCTAGPNQEAVEAASAYSDELGEWSQKLSAAAETARTATSAEWEAAGEGELGFEEVGLGEVLGAAPQLKAFKPDEVAHTPSYSIAARVAEQVELIAEELAGMEPEALQILRGASSDSYWVVADLYYNTLGGPAADRLTARSEALDHLDDFPRFSAMQREASLAFAEQRLALLGDAVEAMGGTVEGDGRTVIPESGLGVSIGAFIVDWLEEEAAFQEDAIEEIGDWTSLSTPYDRFWNYGNVNGAFTAPERNANALRPALVALVAEFAAALSHPATEAEPALPSLGDPYRQVLLDGYRPWGDPTADQDYTIDRLWMLWRIRELENTPDAAYAAARAALIEELNRSLEDGEGIDFRPGSGRLLSVIEAYTDRFAPDIDVAPNREMIVALQEAHGYGEALGRYAMTAEVRADFEAVLSLYAELNEKIAAVLEGELDGVDQYEAIADHGEDYQQKILDAASPSLGALDDDAQAEQLLAAAIRGTAPGGASAVPSPSPTP